MTDKLKELTEKFTPPFRASGRSVTDSEGFVVCTIVTGLVTSTEGATLAQTLADRLNESSRQPGR